MYLRYFESVNEICKQDYSTTCSGYATCLLQESSAGRPRLKGKNMSYAMARCIGETVLLESDTFGVRFPRSPKEELTRTFGCYLLGIHTFKVDGGSKHENESEAEICSGRCRVDGG